MAPTLGPPIKGTAAEDAQSCTVCLCMHVCVCGARARARVCVCVCAGAVRPALNDHNGERARAPKRRERR